MPDDVVKPKPVPFKKIEPLNPDGTRNRWYVEMDRLVAAYHPELVEYKLTLIWKRGWKPDKDGKLILGQAVKASEDAKQCHGQHGYIRLNEEWYHDATTRDIDKIAVLDHELCHFSNEVDKNGDTRMDEDSVPCIRMVKHDVEEFECIIDRYGLYTDRLRRVAGTMFNARERERLAAARRPGAAATPQPQANEDPAGIFEEEQEELAPG